MPHIHLEPEDGGGRAFDREPSKSLGLYTLGRIFEQSIKLFIALMRKEEVARAA